jgi:hypothetical protein
MVPRRKSEATRLAGQLEGAGKPTKLNHQARDRSPCICNDPEKALCASVSASTPRVSKCAAARRSGCRRPTRRAMRR